MKDGRNFVVDLLDEKNRQKERLKIHKQKNREGLRIYEVVNYSFVNNHKKGFKNASIKFNTEEQTGASSSKEIGNGYGHDRPFDLTGFGGF